MSIRERWKKIVFQMEKLKNAEQDEHSFRECLNDRIEEGTQLLQIIKSPGWNIVEKILQELRKPERIIPTYEKMNNTNEVSRAIFESGKIAGIEEFSLQIIKVLELREEAVKQLKTMNYEDKNAGKGSYRQSI